MKIFVFIYYLAYLLTKISAVLLKTTPLTKLVPAPKEFSKTAQIINFVNSVYNENGKGALRNGNYNSEATMESGDVEGWLNNVWNILQNTYRNSEEYQQKEQGSWRYHLIDNPEDLDRYRAQLAEKYSDVLGNSDYSSSFEQDWPYSTIRRMHEIITSSYGTNDEAVITDSPSDLVDRIMPIALRNIASRQPSYYNKNINKHNSYNTGNQNENFMAVNNQRDELEKDPEDWHPKPYLDLVKEKYKPSQVRFNKESKPSPSWAEQPKQTPEWVKDETNTWEINQNEKSIEPRKDKNDKLPRDLGDGWSKSPLVMKENVNNNYGIYEKQDVEPPQQLPPLHPPEPKKKNHNKGKPQAAAIKNEKKYIKDHRHNQEVVRNRPGEQLKSLNDNHRWSYVDEEGQVNEDGERKDDKKKVADNFSPSVRKNKHVDKNKKSDKSSDSDEWKKSQDELSKGIQEWEYHHRHANYEATNENTDTDTIKEQGTERDIRKNKLNSKRVSLSSKHNKKGNHEDDNNDKNIYKNHNTWNRKDSDWNNKQLEWYKINDDDSDNEKKAKNDEVWKKNDEDYIKERTYENDDDWKKKDSDWTKNDDKNKDWNNKGWKKRDDDRDKNDDDWNKKDIDGNEKDDWNKNDKDQKNNDYDRDKKIDTWKKEDEDKGKKGLKKEDDWDSKVLAWDKKLNVENDYNEKKTEKNDDWDEPYNDITKKRAFNKKDWEIEKHDENTWNSNYKKQETKRYDNGWDKKDDDWNKKDDDWNKKDDNWNKKDKGNDWNKKIKDVDWNKKVKAHEDYDWDKKKDTTSDWNKKNDNYGRGKKKKNDDWDNYDSKKQIYSKEDSGYGNAKPKKNVELNFSPNIPDYYKHKPVRDDDEGFEKHHKNDRPMVRTPIPYRGKKRLYDE